MLDWKSRQVTDALFLKMEEVLSFSSPYTVQWSVKTPADYKLQAVLITQYLSAPRIGSATARPLSGVNVDNFIEQRLNVTAPIGLTTVYR